MRVQHFVAAFAVAWAFSIGTLSLDSQSSKQKKVDAVRQADAAFHAGYAARQAGQLEAARAQFAKVVRLAPQIAEGREALGAVLIEMGHPAEAIPQLEAAAK